MARVAELSAEITAETGDFERGLSNVEKSIAGTRTTVMGLDKDIKLMGRNMGSASDAMHGLGINLPITPMAGLGQAIGFVGSQLKASVNETVEYAKQVRDLGRSIGATAEETSKLIQAADDVNVSYGSLTSALEAAIRKGVEPSIAGMGRLADEYNAIQDPIARTKFLMDNFGRSGADLAPLMEQGAAGIRELGQAAEDTGLVMSGEAVAAAREYEKSVDNLEDSFMALKLTVGQQLIPPLTEVMDNFNKGQVLVRKWNEALEAGVMTSYEADKAWFRLHSATSSVDDELEEVTARLAPIARGMANASNMVDMMTGSQNEGAVASYELADSYDRAALAATMGGKAIKEYAAAQVTASMDAANSADRLAAGLAGRLQDAQEDYRDVMAETTPEIARLADAIAKYRAEQGRTFSFTQDATTSANEFELATLKAAEAVRELGEFTGDDQLELAQLKVDADKAQEAVVKLGEGFGFTRDFTIDHTAALAEDSAAMAELVLKQEAAEAALRKATAEMVLQRVAAQLGDDAALEFARATGLMSEADYTLVKATQAAIVAADIDRSGTIDSEAERKKLLDMTLKLTDQTGDLATGTYNAAQNMSDLDAALPPVAAGLDDVTASAVLARDGVERIPPSVAIDTTPAITSLDQASARSDYFGTRLDRLPESVAVDTTPAMSALDEASGRADYFTTRLDRIPRSITVDVITNNHTNYSGYQIPGAAAGADFIVPPGYPHDSYPMRVQSGEHVVVTPAGGAGTSNNGNGNTYNFIFNNPQPITIPTALQTAKATADAW